MRTLILAALAMTTLAGQVDAQDVSRGGRWTAGQQGGGAMPMQPRPMPMQPMPMQPMPQQPMPMQPRPMHPMPMHPMPQQPMQPMPMQPRPGMYPNHPGTPPRPGMYPGHPGMNPPQPGMYPNRPGMSPRPGFIDTRGGGYRPGGSRWGGVIQGHWSGGMQAPGGWRGYRRPNRGTILPSYWVSPGFAISDYGTYGLAPPPYGYGWSRYYDDAVLIDARGQVWNSADNIDWSRGDDGYAEEGASYDDGAGYDDRDGYVERRGSGVGGAVVGGVVGGVAGNLIAGRGNRLAGTVIGAGVGAVAGAAIDRSGSRSRHVEASGYGTSYDAPGGRAPRTVYAEPREVVQGEVVQGDYPEQGYVRQSGVSVRTGTVSGGYYYPPAAITTVTIQSAPMVTTTTTEYVETVRTTRRVARPKRTWHPRPRAACCTCGCR